MGTRWQKQAGILASRRYICPTELTPTSLFLEQWRLESKQTLPVALCSGRRDLTDSLEKYSFLKTIVWMTNKKIICIGPLAEQVIAEFEPEFETIAVSDSCRQEVLDSVDESVAVIIARGSVIVDAEIMDKAANLQLVARSGVGYDTVNIEDATARGLPVVYTPGAMSRAVAEHTLSFMLTALKKLDGWKNCLNEDNWPLRYQDYSLDVQDAIVGIIGYGRIGKQVRRLLRNFDVKVLANDPYIDHSLYQNDEVEFVGFEDLLSVSDIVTLHVPLNEETRGMISADTLARVKRGAVLINTARGSVVEGLDLLCNALNDGLLSAVGLDVFPEEPPDTSHPIFKHPKAFLTPHVAARTRTAQNQIQMDMIAGIRSVISGAEPNLNNIVNPEVFST